MPRKLLLVVVLLLSLGGLAAAYIPFRSYAAVWRRPVAKVPRCVLAARVVLRKPSLVSGSEPNFTATGDTVYLTPNETRSVGCVKLISAPLGGRFAQVFTEIEPELRALEIVKVLRDVPPSPESDREASTAYFIGSAALMALPDLPEVKAARDEIEELHGCRFLSDRPCPRRPPIPVVVWITGVPSAIGMLVVLGALGRFGFLRARDRWRAWRARRAQGSTSSTKTPPVALG